MENRCICCGEVIPEGRMVCKNCEIEAENRLTMKQRKRVSDCSEQPSKNRTRLFMWGRQKGATKGVRAAL